MTASPHLWLALSPHGFGHAAMTASVVAELRRRIPALRLTIQTTVAENFLVTRYQDFHLVPEIHDFGFHMVSSTGIDLEASAAAYARLHGDFPAIVHAEALRLREAAPDLVLANVPYVTLAAAAQAEIPSIAMSSLNWADMYAHYLGDRPEASAILAEIRTAYASARVFLCCTPSQAMTLPNLRQIGPIAVRGQNLRNELARTLELGQGGKVGMIAFGGINHPLALEEWPRMEGWVWLSSMSHMPQRPDFRPWQEVGVNFADLVASVDVVMTKPGYGTFTEAALAGTPVLYVPRTDWPESPFLDEWLAQHTRCLAVEEERLISADLPGILQKLLLQPERPAAHATGVDEAADIIQSML